MIHKEPKGPYHSAVNKNRSFNYKDADHHHNGYIDVSDGFQPDHVLTKIRFIKLLPSTPGLGCTMAMPVELSQKIYPDLPMV